MFKDVVFHQNYAKQIESYVQNIAHHAFISGCNQTLNNVMAVLEKLESENIKISSESLSKEFEKMIKKKFSMNESEKSEEVENKKSPILSVVR